MVDPNASEWLKSQQRGSRRHRIIVITIGILILVGIVGAMVYFLKLNKSSPNGNDSNENLGGGGNNSSPDKYFTWDKRPVNLTIVPNPNLKKVFYGMNYGPVNGSFPWCTNTLGDMIEDIKVLSQLTDRLRLYGMDCHAADWTLEAISLLKLNMTIVPTIWVDNNDTTYKRQYDDFFSVIQKYGVDRIDGVSVGNEAIFRKEITTQVLYERIADVRKKVNSMGFTKKIPVFTSDLGSNVNQEMATSVDEIWANIHPYFAGVEAKYAADWSFKFFDQNDVYYGNQTNKPTIMSEVGWPTAGEPHGDSVATVPNLQTFLDTFVCAANSRNVRYYYFEALDAPWKTARWTLLEGSWGLLNPDLSIKSNLKIPDCK